MANELTGDFDVVTQFAIPAVDRILAAMHRAQRFPHSLSIVVDDGPVLTAEPPRTLRTIVDRLGDAIADPVWLGLEATSAASLPALDPGLPADPVVGIGRSRPIPGFDPPSELRGIAQVQLSSPTLSIPDDTGERVTVHMQMRARYFAAAGTRPMPEYLRGEIRITVSVTRVTS